MSMTERDLTPEDGFAEARVVRPTGQIGMTVACLGERLDQIGSQLRDLHERLDPVLRPEGPTAVAERLGSDRMVASSLVMRLTSLVERAEELSEALSGLDSRLDL